MNKLLQEAEAEGTSILIKRNGSVQSSSSFVDVEDGAFESDLAFHEAQLAYATDNKLIHDIRASWASAELKAAYQAVGSDNNWPLRRQSWSGHTS